MLAKISNCLGNDVVGTYDKKLYVWADDGGEKVQVAISLTCPKNPVGEVDMSSAFSDGIDFTASSVVVPTSAAPAEITQEEQDNIATLMARLGL